MAEPKPSVRLPRSYIPEKYTIHYSLIQLEEPFQFQANEEVLLDVKESSPTITLHSQNLVLTKVELHAADGSKQSATNISYDEKQSTVTLAFQTAPAVGSKVKLEIHFEGKLNDKLNGLYRSSYVKDGKKKFLAVTQMEPVDCRRAVPCWDEPDLKAVFEVSLVKARENVAISNMPITEEKDISETQTLVKFAPTPKMSTYLLAIIVGEFEYLESVTPEGVKLRIYLPPGKREQGHFALGVATKALSFLTKHFGIEYPLPKSDLICISEFAAGAMENWGAVTYRDIKLLIDDESSLVNKHGAARTIAHELAHMWFGNLVTMRWWTDLWLNEGFARFTEFIAVNDIFPEWDIWSSFNVSVLGHALGADSLKTSHPIQVEVNHPAEINEIFDAISYSKGASVLRMLATYLTHDVFLKGLRIYLNRFKFSNAATEDLWAALEEASGKPVQEIMADWTKQTGYPVVAVEEILSDDKSKIVGLRLQQKRFLKSGETDATLWKVPVDYATEETGSTVFSELLSTESAEVRFKTPIAASSWIKLNVKQTGLYRVNYSASLLERLKAPIAAKTLGNVDRLSIIGDAFAVSNTGKISLANVLSLVQSFKNEHEYYVWSQISSNIGELSVLVSQEAFAPSFKKYIISIFEPLFKGVLKGSWDTPPDSKDALDIPLRALCVARLGYAGHAEVIAEARKRFHAFVVEGNQAVLKADFRLSVFKIVLENGGEQEFNQLLKLYRTSDSVEEKRRCLQVLGFVQDEKLIQQVLEFSLSDEVRKNDVSFPLNSVASNPKGRQLVWEFVKKRWDTIYKSFSEGQFLLPNIIDCTTSRFTTKEAAEDVRSFFKEHPIPDAQRTILQCLETIENQANFLASQGQKIASWLSENGF